MTSPARVSRESLLPLYRARAELPRRYTGAGGDALAAHAAARAARALAREGVRAFVAGSPPQALAAYQPLPWDSELLGLRAGTICLLELPGGRGEPGCGAGGRSDALLDAALGAAREAGAEYVTVRVAAESLHAIQALEDRGFRLLDAILGFACDLAEPLPPAPDALPVRDAREEDLPELRAIAARAFRHDRFHVDPLLPDAAADALHAAWVENGVRGATGCGVLVAEHAGRPAGFFLLEEDPDAQETLGFGIGTLSLIAVDAAARRRGVGAALSRAALARLRERGQRFAEVGTQLANRAASNLYARAGFRLVDAQVTLRSWSGGR